MIQTCKTLISWAFTYATSWKKDETLVYSNIYNCVFQAGVNE